MKAKKKGSVTIFAALVMLMFLTFCLVLAEGARIYFLRVKAMQAMELAEFSVLSEYQQELFSKYGLFFLDLDYEQGTEQLGILEQRAEKYLMENAEELTTKELQAEQFWRAADDGGSVFFEQAVAQMKFQSGYQIIEELLENVGDVSLDEVDLEQILKQKEEAAEGVLPKAAGEENKIPMISLPKISFPSINALTEAVFGENTGLSKQTIDVKERIGERELSTGAGQKGDESILDMQMFHGYIFEHCSYYGAKNPNLWTDVLKYQVEYILAGEESDQKNLENVMWRIFLFRAGGNYLFYHQDAEKTGIARARAVALVGFLGNAALIEAVKELFLIVQAIEDGIAETRLVFAGEKVPLYQKGAFTGIKLGYQEYLYLLLNMTDRTEKIYRCMDIVELEVREKSGYGNLRLDHCADRFTLQWTYEYPSLFMDIPLLNGGVYEHSIKRKFYYEQ